MRTFNFKNITKKDLDLLKNGGVGVLPTDTIYGLATSVYNRESVKRLYHIKKREAKPGTIILSSVDQLIDLNINHDYINMAKKYWPGPNSVIIPVDDSLEYIHQGKNSLAFRVVKDKEVAKLLRITGPLLTSSANMPGDPVANNIIEAKSVFGNLVDFYIDGGDLSDCQASSVILLDKAGDIFIRR